MVQSQRGKQLAALFVYEPDSFVPLATVQQGQIYWYQCDQIGAPLELTDAQGQIVWSAMPKRASSPSRRRPARDCCARRHWRIDLNVLTQPKPCSMSLRFYCDWAHPKVRAMASSTTEPRSDLFSATWDARFYRAAANAADAAAFLAPRWGALPGRRPRTCAKTRRPSCTSASRGVSVLTANSRRPLNAWCALRPYGGIRSTRAGLGVLSHDQDYAPLGRLTRHHASLGHKTRTRASSTVLGHFYAHSTTTAPIPLSPPAA